MTEEEFSEPLSSRDVKKRLSLSGENFSFYCDWGYIRKSKVKGKFEYALKMHHMFLERGTVFKYCFEDSYNEDLRVFKETVKHTGKCKTWSKKEIVELEAKLESVEKPEQREEIIKRIKEIKSVLKIT